MVVVAQLVRALDCGSRGRRFEPGLPPKKARLSGLFLFFILALPYLQQVYSRDWLLLKGVKDQSGSILQ
jgi:hypothetical protein